MPDRRLSRRRFLSVVGSAAAAGIATPRAARAAGARAFPRGGTHFVLVHGGWHGAWCWYKIVAGLEAAGQRVTVLDLPSAGIDGTPAGTVTLTTQAARVIALLDGLTEPVVLVGHSAGGPVISLVAEARPAKIEKLVYVTAYLLPDGVGIAQFAATDTGSLVTSHLVINLDNTVDVDPAGRREVFYADCAAADVALAQSLLKPLGVGALVEPVHVGGNFAGVRRFYVSCLRDDAISPAAQKRMFTALPCEQVLTIRSSHSPFLSRPAALLRALAKIARA